MKRFAALLGLLCVFPVFAQQNWQATLPDKLGLIENLDRYDNIMGEEILYHATSGKHKFFISKNAIFVGQQEEVSQQELYEKWEKYEHGEEYEPIGWNYFKIDFFGANENVEVFKKSPRAYTSNFQSKVDPTKTIVAKAYEEVTITNLYDGISITYYYDDETGGLKYSFLVNSSADILDIRMRYEGAKIELNDDGSLKINSKLDPFTDASPTAETIPQTGPNGEIEQVGIKYHVHENSVMFYADDYNKHKGLMIDPWLTSPLSFTTTQQAMDIGYDDSGNLYVLGNGGDEVAMYDNTGMFQWLWSGPPVGFIAGDLCTKPSTDEVYMIYVADNATDPEYYRLSSTGVVTASYNILAGDPQESWRVSYDEVNDQIIIGGGGVGTFPQVTLMDVDLTTAVNYEPIPSIFLDVEDVALLWPADDGASIYFLVSAASDPANDRILVKVDEPNPANVQWQIDSQHPFTEANNAQYAQVFLFAPNGFNGITQTSSFIYTYDGNMLKQWDPNTGIAIDSVLLGVTPLMSGGLASDDCGNLYLGTTDSVLIFDESLNQNGGFNMPAAVYDMVVGNNKLYVGGENFVQEIDIAGGGLPMNVAPTQCSGCFGTASIDTTASCPGYFFDNVVWTPGGATTDTITNLCAGWYIADATWINGLGDTITATDSVEVLDNGSNITATEDSTAVSCVGSCDGTITLVATSGVAPYTYDIGTQSNSTGIFTGLCENTYNITITDDNGCTYTGTISIVAGSGNITVTEVFTNESCPGSCDGTITLTPTSGVSPYLFDIGTASNATGNFTGLCTGNYVITVTDDNGCDYNSNINISSSGGLGLDTVITSQPTCNGFNDGSITVTATGGVPPITYTWTPVNPVPGPTFNNLTAGTYLVVASDSNGACQDSLTVILDEPDSIFAQISIFDPLCYGFQTGIAIVDTVYNAQGNLNNISYFWNPNPGGQGGVGADSTGSMGAGNYTLTINDDFGCSVVQDFTIVEPDSLYFSELGFDPAYCRVFPYQSGNGVVYAAGAGGTPDYDYLWVNLTDPDTAFTTTWGGLNPGTYQITVTDDNGCQLTSLIEMDSLSPIAAFTVISAQLDANCEGTEIVNAQFTNQSLYYANPNNPQADTTFFWNLNHDNTGWYVSHDVNELIDTSYTGEFIYEVCLVAINKNGCSDTACKNIIVHAMPELIPPNIFTPNGGTENEVFTFANYATAISEFKCIIVNRWGVTVAELNGVTDSWDGTDMNGSESPEGVYFYTYEAMSTNGTAFEGQGTVQLVRGN